MERLTQFALRRKALVGLLILAGFLLGLAATPLTVARISEDYQYPGMPSYEANQAIVETYGNGGYQRPYVPVVVLPDGWTVDSPGARQALARAEAQASRPGLEILEAAMRNATPIIEVKPRRVGGATYQVPVEIRGDRRMSLGVRWLVQAARKRSGKSMSEKLAAELVDAMNGLGAAVKRREDTHKMAEANRAFSHFKW